MSREVEFELTAHDNVLAMRTHTGRFAGWLAFVVLDIGLLVAAFDLYVRMSPFSDWHLWLILGLSLSLLLWDQVFRDLLIGRQFRQSQPMQSAAHVHWDDAGISFDTPNSRARFEWTQFYRWMGSKTTLLLYRDAGFFFLIPRRVLADEQFYDMVAALKASGVKER